MNHFITIDETTQTFVRDGEPFLYLADTAWSAITNARPDEWDYYLELRRRQGFTAIQINLLPQWDRSIAATKSTGPEPVPFELSGSAYDFTRPIDSYFEHAEQMIGKVVEHDLVPALVLLWAKFVPGNWCSDLNPGNTIAREAIGPYVEYIAKRFARFNPVFMVSGDTNFPGTEVVEWYRDAILATKEAAANCLTTLHIAGKVDAIPDALDRMAELDFYMYQTGHYPDQSHVSGLTRKFWECQKRPVVNGEICYEGIGRFGDPRKFTGRDTRYALWMSLMNGSKAGVTYGASGIWDWHLPGSRRTGFEGYGQTFTVWEAMHFPGAWDVGIAGYLYHELGLRSLEPDNTPGPIDTAVASARCSGGQKWVAYLATPCEIVVPDDVDDERLTLYDFDTGHIVKLKAGRRKDKTVVVAAPVGTDALLVGKVT